MVLNPEAISEDPRIRELQTTDPVSEKAANDF